MTSVDDFNVSVFTIIPLIMRPTVLKAMQANKDAILDICDKLRSNLIELISTVSYNHLQSVSSIPRLYRKTNKELPMQPSNYVLEGVKPITLFFNNSKDFLEEDIGLILDLLVKRLGEQ